MVGEVHFVGFHVARTDKDPRQKGAAVVDNKMSQAAQVAERMARMELGESQGTS